MRNKKRREEQRPARTVTLSKRALRTMVNMVPENSSELCSSEEDRELWLAVQRIEELLGQMADGQKVKLQIK